jgi:hypothetical protein
VKTSVNVGLGSVGFDDLGKAEEGVIGDEA